MGYPCPGGWLGQGVGSEGVHVDILRTAELAPSKSAARVADLSDAAAGFADRIRSLSGLKHGATQTRSTTPADGDAVPRARSLLVWHQPSG